MPILPTITHSLSFSVCFCTQHDFHFIMLFRIYFLFQSYWRNTQETHTNKRKCDRKEQREKALLFVWDRIFAAFILPFFLFKRFCLIEKLHIKLFAQYIQIMRTRTHSILVSTFIVTVLFLLLLLLLLSCCLAFVFTCQESGRLFT